MKFNNQENCEMLLDCRNTKMRFQCCKIVRYVAKYGNAIDSKVDERQLLQKIAGITLLITG